MKTNKHNLLHYAKLTPFGISVPASRIVRSEGFQKNYEAMKRIFKKQRGET